MIKVKRKDVKVGHHFCFRDNIVEGEVMFAMDSARHWNGIQFVSLSVDHEVFVAECAEDEVLMLIHRMKLSREEQLSVADELKEWAGGEPLRRWTVLYRNPSDPPLWRGAETFRTQALAKAKAKQLREVLGHETRVIRE